jgi:hypothetical protein
VNKNGKINGFGKNLADELCHECVCQCTCVCFPPMYANNDASNYVELDNAVRSKCVEYEVGA